MAQSKKMFVVMMLASCVASAETYLVRSPISTRGSSFAREAESSQAKVKVVDLSEAEVQKLEARGYQVEKDQPIQLFQDQLQDVKSASANWAFAAIRGPTAHQTPGPMGDEVRICVIDSGVDVTHPQLQGAIVGGINLSDDGAPEDYRDNLHHGTYVASLMVGREKEGQVGVAPRAQVYAVKIFDQNGASSLGRLISALQICAERTQVINMSLGGAVESQLTLDVLKEIKRKGITLVAAAGNSGGALTLPASSPDVIAVGSINSRLQISEFSNQGKTLAFVAPGEEVPVLTSTGDLKAVSGTSFSSPFVAGAEALRISRKAKSLKGMNLGFPNETQGSGLIDLYQTVLSR